MLYDPYIGFFNRNLKMLNLNKIKLAVIGLGYVGLPLAVEFGKKREVIGFDIDTTRIKDLEE